MAIYDLYRGDVFYRKEEIPGPEHRSVQLRHIPPFKPQKRSVSAGLPALDTVETFVLDERTGRYVSRSANSATTHGGKY